VSNAEAANKVTKQVTSYGTEAVAIQANSRDKGSPEHIIQSTLQAFSSEHIDILVNNAGTNANKHFSEATCDDFDEIFETNVRGPAFLTQAALKVLRKGGRVITISSMATRTQSNASLAFYTGTKGAMEAMTRAWASSYPELGCTFNCVLPGPVDTGLFPSYYRRKRRGNVTNAIVVICRDFG
jgi:3-oxoacyl-[acyl-carrier protein] reductase